MKHRGAKTHHPHGHPAVWATLTIIAFPLVSISLDAAGFGALGSFAGGALASLVVLLLEGVVRGRWWISEPAIAETLENPELGWRLLVLTGIIILLFQSFVLVGFLTHRSLDENVLRFVLSRQCASPQNTFLAHACDVLAQDTKIHPLNMAVREGAERRFFPGGFVTCAVLPIDAQSDTSHILYGSLVRCDRWEIGTITRLPTSRESIERPVFTTLRAGNDGVYQIDGWSDDPASTEWQALGGSFADDVAKEAFEQLTERSDVLRQETYRRAMEALRGN